MADMWRAILGRTAVLGWVIGLAIAAGPGCGDETCETEACAKATTLSMDFTSSDFFAAPFPNDARRDPAGKPDLSGFPNPVSVALVDSIVAQVARDANGFGLSSGIFFRADAALASETLPDLEASSRADSPVQLVGASPESPDFLVRYPIRVRFSSDPGPYGPPQQLALLPLQGVPLLPNARYAAFVTRDLQDAKGKHLGVSPGLEPLLRGGSPAGMSEAVRDEHLAAIAALEQGGIAKDRLAALTVFSTGDPARPLLEISETARADFSRSFAEAPQLIEQYPSFCVYQGSVDMPVYQEGTPPYLDRGGGFEFDTAGKVVLQRMERARVWITIPKSAMPQAGYPFAVMSRTGGGGDRPLIDRGVRGEPGGEALLPGTGPALEFARVGFAGVSADGPHGGPRNVSGGDEQLLVYNFQNPLALRDNLRQSAMELALLPDLLLGYEFDISACQGASAPQNLARLDLSTAALMGHSMGASIAPLTAAIEPRYRALLLSGAGGSFLENLLHKEKPLPVRPLAELILGLTAQQYSLTEDSTALALLQWAGEPADSPLYGRALIQEPWVGEPRHILMMQGIVDHYILPPIANAASLSFGLDLAGPGLDAETPELALFEPLGSLLPLVGRTAIPLPAQNNVISAATGQSVTAVVIQTREDGLEDGHEIMFQLESPKHAYGCFLAGLLAGAPRVPQAGKIADGCAL